MSDERKKFFTPMEAWDKFYNLVGLKEELEGNEDAIGLFKSIFLGGYTSCLNFLKAVDAEIRTGAISPEMASDLIKSVDISIREYVRERR